MVDNKTETLNLDQSYALTRQKLIVVGDVAVGKTSIVNSFLGLNFKDEYEV
jgi:GTPase SAR1 family protein